ncbi:MAG: hypothetical protein AAGF85_06360 [Bacteroidota bacterium]
MKFKYIYLLHNLLFMSFFCHFSKYNFIFCFIGLTFSELAWSSGKYPVRNFGPGDYYAGIQNIDFAQNRDMNLFVANNLGILSFDGNQWSAHALNTGKKQRSLAFDDETDRLYVGSQGDFGFFQKNWEYVSLIKLIPESSRDFDEVWDVFLHDSKVYFCTFQAIYSYNGKSINVIDHPEGFDHSFLTGNRLFTQTKSGQLFEIKNDQLTNSLEQGKSNAIVAGLVQYKVGYLIFYNSGSIEYSNLSNSEKVFPNFENELLGKYVNHVLQLSDTRLVISTQRSGIYLFDPQKGLIENIGPTDGLLSSDCLRSFQDYIGNLWVGMQNGIAMVDINSPMRLINNEINLKGSGYEVFETDEGYYYTTSNGIYFLATAATKSIFLSGTEGPAYAMSMINGKLYAGHHTGLFQLKNGRARRSARTTGLWEIKRLRSNPEFAIGGTYFGLHLFRIDERGDLVSLGKVAGFNESSRFFEEDRSGRIWVGQFYKGLYRMSFDKTFSTASVIKVSDSYDLPIKEHIILSRINDEIYIGTEMGLYRIDQNKDSIVSSELFSNDIGNNWVYLLAQDRQKNVHIFTNNKVGFFRQVSANNYAYVPSSLFHLRQTFNNDLLRLSMNVSNGVLFDANEGFIRYDPSLEDRRSLQKAPLVNRVFSVAEDSILFERLPFENRTIIEPIVITEGIKVLQFEVESFKFRNVNNSQFRYFLKGFDDQYGEWMNSTLKEYTNLKEGEYEFSVQTFNYLGEIITSDPLILKVKPPFFKSLFAKIFYVVLGVLLVVQGYRFQRSYYRSKQKRLEEAKQEELEQKHQELQDLKEEKINDELRHVNNLLAASTMNLVVKNEFMENIKEEIKQVNTNHKVEETQKALQRIVREIDTTLKVQEDWKQFEYHFDQVHGDFLTRLTGEFLDLTPGEQKLCAFLRLKMDTKEIANLMGVSLRGVEVARYRLRKKLLLDHHQNLSKFILEY